MRSSKPSVAASARVRGRRAPPTEGAFHCLNPRASASGGPPPKNGAGSFDVSTRIKQRVQRRDVVAAGCPMQRCSWCGPRNRALTSAPAATNTAIDAATSGKWPGQSVATCSRLRDIPSGSSSPSRAVTNDGFAASKRLSVSRSPVAIAATVATASGSRCRWSPSAQPTSTSSDGAQNRRGQDPTHPIFPLRPSLSTFRRRLRLVTETWDVLARPDRLPRSLEMLIMAATRTLIASWRAPVAGNRTAMIRGWRTRGVEL